MNVASSASSACRRSLHVLPTTPRREQGALESKPEKKMQAPVFQRKLLEKISPRKSLDKQHNLGTMARLVSVVCLMHAIRHIKHV